MERSNSQVSPDRDLNRVASLLDEIQELTLARHESSTALELPTIADPHDLQDGIAHLSSDLPGDGWGLERVGRYLLDQVAPTLAPGQSATRYFGFVTGGVLPIAAIADNLVTLFDSNVQVHLPKETLSTLIEDHTITLLLQLLSLPQDQFTGTLTTGATTANLLGMACAREEVLERIMSAKTGQEEWSMSEEGFSENVPAVNVFVAIPHASIKKAAALTAIGRKRVVDVGLVANFSNTDTSSSEFLTREEDIKEGVKVLDFDLVKLEASLRSSQEAGNGSIIVVGMGEVNTGSLCNQLPRIKQLATRYKAWIHVDAAFSAFVSLIDEFKWVGEHLANYADSITSDAHKQLNVPYDTGLLFIRKRSKRSSNNISLLQDVCGPGKNTAAPAYLKAGQEQAVEDDDDDVSEAARELKRKSAYAASLPSPLFKNLENSRRFRALPLYAALLSEGQNGLKAIVQRNVEFARAIEDWMRTEASSLYQVLTPATNDNLPSTEPWSKGWATTILLFRPHPIHCPNESYRRNCTAFINAVKSTRRIYISPTSWHGIGAARIAVSNWRTGLEDAEGKIVDDVRDSLDFKVTIETLRTVMRD
ncbi:unnamed protein product [Sympodiomycopsis kandeliae]